MQAVAGFAFTGARPAGGICHENVRRYGKPLPQAIALTGTDERPAFVDKDEDGVADTDTPARGSEQLFEPAGDDTLTALGPRCGDSRPPRKQWVPDPETAPSEHTCMDSAGKLRKFSTILE